VRIAVAGGTGLVGRHTIDSLTRDGHETVSLSRSNGIDLTIGSGLDDALVGVDAVIDVTNTPAMDAAQTRAFFGGVTEHLLAAEQRAGVSHHVMLSIVGIDDIEGNPHYAGKQRQEQLVSSGPVPFTIQRATQFHEFAEMVVSWTRENDKAVVPPLLIQPVAAADVAAVLAELALGPPLGRAPDLAGPATEDLVDMARRALTARDEQIRLVPSWNDGPFGVAMAGNVLLPGDGARIAPTTFNAWLDRR
jgi:uncharacterized protein YbjT (DUF2867 family)